MRPRKAIAQRLLAALALAGIAALAQARPFDEIRKAGTLRVATEGAFAPFNYYQGSKLTGFEIEVAEAVAAKMGVKLEWKSLGFDALLAGLRQDRWDLVIASHSITDERAKVVTFADPHYCSGAVIVAKDPGLKAAKDLTGKTVAVQTGTTYMDHVKKISGVKEVKTFPQDTDARSALLTGRVDAWVTERFGAMNAVAASPQSGMKIGNYLFMERIAAAVGKGNASLAGEWNKALAAVMTDGSYAKISTKWFSEDIRCK